MVQRVLCVLALVVLANTAAAQSAWDGQRLHLRFSGGLDGESPTIHDEHDAIRARKERIEAECAKIRDNPVAAPGWAREWTGRYYQGDGLGTNMSIYLAPDAGIALLNYGCLGLYGADHGEVAEVLPDGLRLKLRFGDARKSFLSERVYFVRWGDDRYLVPDWLMPEFIENYNEGGIERSEMWGIPRLIAPDQSAHRMAGSVRAPAGRPQLPKEFAEKLRDRQLELTVIEVTPVGVKPGSRGEPSHVARFKFKGGSEQGIRSLMIFEFPADDGRPPIEIHILEVGPDGCSGFASVPVAAGAEPRWPKVGDVLRSGGSDAEPDGGQKDGRK